MEEQQPFGLLPAGGGSAVGGAWPPPDLAGLFGAFGGDDRLDVGSSAPLLSAAEATLLAYSFAGLVEADVSTVPYLPLLRDVESRILAMPWSPSANGAHRKLLFALPAGGEALRPTVIVGRRLPLSAVESFHALRQDADPRSDFARSLLDRDEALRVVRPLRLRPWTSSKHVRADAR